MDTKYLRLICNPNKWFGENNEENYKVNELLKNLGSSSWYIGNLKNIKIGMKGIIKVVEDKRPKWLLDRYNVSKLESGIYALIEVIDIKENGRIIIKSKYNYFANNKLINKERITKIIDEKFNHQKQGYFNKNAFDELEKYNNCFIYGFKKSIMSFSWKVEGVIPTIDKISIKDYFFLENIEIKNLQENKEIYIVGENGDGKTLFLQALALALNGNREIGLISDYIKPTKDKMKLLVMDTDNNKYQYNNSDNSYKNIIAYGVNRGKYLEKGDIYSYLTLFNNDINLSNPENWLKNLDYKELKEESGFIPLATVKLMLKNILDNNIEDIEVQSFGISFIERGTYTTLDKLSEGYKSVIIWICDLLMRLSKFQPSVTDIKDFYGIVLVDEIDLHLHPKWAYSIVRKLREWFPNIQFIFTTHSPTVILGASNDAIFFKIYKEDGVSKISQPINNIKNMMANTVSTSPLFGLSSARAKNSDGNLDTRDDFVYSKIHNKIAQRVNSNNSITEDDILKMIDDEFELFDKENTL